MLKISRLSQRVFATLLPLALVVGPGLALACPPGEHSLDELLALPGKEFVVESDALRNRLARQLLDCVGHPDPAVRDGVVYSAYATWLRGKLLTDDTILALLQGLSGQLGAQDPEGFTRPFAALDLAEVARSDRITPLFSAGQREQLVNDAASYISGIGDYRGYSDAEGWRHGVAHASDLALQLVLNSEVSPAQAGRLLDALSGQISPAGEVFYVFGEPARIARPVYYAFVRGDLGPDIRDAWFARLADPSPLGAWSELWESRAGLARRHNLQAFLQALYVMADSGGSEAGPALKERVVEVMRLL